MTKALYITTPIYYVNDSPHLGHAYTTIACDVMARYQRLSGRDVFFLTGTDEHGQKVDKAAKDAGIDPQAFTDEVSQRFRALVKSPDGKSDNTLHTTNNDFIRTTEARHKKAAQALWNTLVEKGFVYLDRYAGWYSVRDEAFYQESELVNGKAPTGADVEWTEEESYFFKLSAFGDRLLELYEKNPEFVLPKSRLNEVISFVKGGLKDLSISRTSFAWGVPVPGAPKHVMPAESQTKHVMYVWIDALCNYLTAVGYPDVSGNTFQNYWSNGDVVHVVGKDILRFHAVYWPAFLMAADLPLPKHIVAHGWWTIEGEKMSKSLGNVLSPADMIERAGSIDALRYFLLRAMPFGNDGDFSKERLVEIINADLANNIGNLAQRVLKLVQKNSGGQVPAAATFTEEDTALFKACADQAKAYQQAMEGFEFHRALEALYQLASAANLYIDKQQPWALKKTDEVRMGVVLFALLEVIRHLAVLLQPFAPTAADKMLGQLVVVQNARGIQHLTEAHRLKPGAVLPEPEGIFPRLETKAAA